MCNPAHHMICFSPSSAEESLLLCFGFFAKGNVPTTGQKLPKSDVMFCCLIWLCSLQQKLYAVITLLFLDSAHTSLILLVYVTNCFHLYYFVHLFDVCGLCYQREGVLAFSLWVLVVFPNKSDDSQGFCLQCYGQNIFLSLFFDSVWHHNGIQM